MVTERAITLLYSMPQRSYSPFRCIKEAWRTTSSSPRCGGKNRSVDLLWTHFAVHYCAKGAFRWLPAHVFSYSCGLLGHFHGGNTGSNPVEDANQPAA